MTADAAGILLLALGLLLAAMAAFAWEFTSKLPTHRVRSAIFGSRATRIMTIISGLFAAGVGVFLLVSAD